MQIRSFNINLTSEDPERLARFYRDVLQLPVDAEMGEAAFVVAGGQILIDGHSETSGKAKEPQRVLINFFVEDLAAEQARLEAQGVPFIRSKGKEFWGGTISTFTDPDGNYLQLLEFHPAWARPRIPQLPLRGKSLYCGGVRGCGAIASMADAASTS
jgi:predicted enzyme related to lactoylglutathione lyase